MLRCDKFSLIFYLWFCLCVLGLLVAKADFICLGNHTVGDKSCITGIGQGATAQEAKANLVGDTGQEIATVTWRCNGYHVAFTGAFLGRYRWTSTDASGRQYTAYFCSRCDFGIASTPYIITKNIVSYPLNAVIPAWASTSPYFNYSAGSPVFDDYGGVTGISGAVLTPPLNPSTGQPSVVGVDGDWTFAPSDGQPSWNSYRTSAGAVNLDAPVVAPSDGLNNDYVKNMGDKLDASLDNIRDKLDGLYDYSAGLDSRLGSVDSSLSSLGSGVAGLQSSVVGLNSSMSDLQSAMGAVGSGVGGLYGTLNDVYSGVNSVGSAVGGLQAGFDSVASASMANSAKIDALSSQLGTVDYKVEDVGSKVDSLSQKIDLIPSISLTTLEDGQQQLIDIGDGIKVLLEQNFASSNTPPPSSGYTNFINVASTNFNYTTNFVTLSNTNILNLVTTNFNYNFNTNLFALSTTNFNFSTNLISMMGGLTNSGSSLNDSSDTDMSHAQDNLMQTVVDFFGGEFVEGFSESKNSFQSFILSFTAFATMGKSRPDFAFSFSLPEIFGQETDYRFKLTDYLSDDFWRWIETFRDFEVLALCVYFLTKVGQLLFDFFKQS